MLGICAASRWEIRPVLRALRGVRRADVGAVRAWHGRHPGGDVLVFRTGIGRQAAAAAAKEVLALTRLTALLNTGVAGGLASNLAVGHLIIPDLLIEGGTSAQRQYPADAEWSAELWATAARAGLPIDRGPQITWPTVLSKTADKQFVAARFGATAVDMEGTALAAAAERHGVRFGSVRSILDDVDTHLPTLTKRERQSSSLLETDASASPGFGEKISSFLTLAGSFRAAFAALERFFIAFTCWQHE